MTKNDLYTLLMIISVCILIALETKQSYKLGLAEGKLQKMEEFKDTFVPNPSNVFPDATLDTTGGF